MLIYLLMLIIKNCKGSVLETSDVKSMKNNKDKKSLKDLVGNRKLIKTTLYPLNNLDVLKSDTNISQNEASQAHCTNFLSFKSIKKNWSCTKLDEMTNLSKTLEYETYKSNFEKITSEFSSRKPDLEIKFQNFKDKELLKITLDTRTKLLNWKTSLNRLNMKVLPNLKNSILLLKLPKHCFDSIMEKLNFLTDVLKFIYNLKNFKFNNINYALYVIKKNRDFILTCKKLLYYVDLQKISKLCQEEILLNINTGSNLSTMYKLFLSLDKKIKNLIGKFNDHCILVRKYNYLISKYMNEM